VAQRVGRGIALLFHDRGTRGGEWSAARPVHTLPPGKKRYPIYRSLGGPKGRSGQVRKISSPLGFGPGPSSQSLYRLSYAGHIYIYINRVSQEECARRRESVRYVKVYRYNPKHLYPKLNVYGDNGQRKVRSSCGSTYCTCSAYALEVHCTCP